MAKALGVGGIFFKARDPAALLEWYSRALGLPAADGCVAFAPADMPERSYMVWSPFAAGTDYFEPSPQPFMFNLVVDDVEGALAQVEAAGGQRVGTIDDYDYGRFGWFLDPEGNKVEVWEPR
jgi:predicted enzyme related to lactoylglutathione lyase